ncbi:MAG: D-alanyl-D-alanine carboxypeptidase [Clostridiales bacterium]|nr:D-alanyl-D-alanine carboxypeptidase [Clostridiales bacterium]
MAKSVLCVVLAIVLIVYVPGAYAESKTNASAQACVLFCANTGELVLEKNSDKRMPMASTTKIMTALLALEKCSTDDETVEFTYDMIAEGSSMYLKVGEKIRLSELVKGLLAASGNDAANAIAISMCGSIEEFCKLMNSRARSLGMNNTNFVTPSGLDDENHYSTAYDMALLMNCAMQNEAFRDIVSQQDIEVTFEKAEKQKTTYHNHNRLLSEYEYCIGGKTGFTKKSGRCLVTCAEKDGITLIAVTLNAPDDWNDQKAMYDYGFENLRTCCQDDTNINISLPVAGGEHDNVTVNAECKMPYVYNINGVDDIKREFFLPRFVYAPVKKGDALGKIRYCKNGKLFREVPLVAESDVPLDTQKENIFENIMNWFLGIFKGMN